MATKKKTKTRTKKKPAKDCGCVANMNSACRKQGFELVVAFNLSGRTWPVIATKKVEEGSRGPKPPTLVPNYCPFCGKKYPAT